MLLKFKGAIKVAGVYLNRIFWAGMPTPWNEAEITWDEDDSIS